MISAAEIISAATAPEHTISVAWPPAPLGEPGWRTRLEALAEQAESRIGKVCGLKQTAAMALELVGVLWPALGAPETIAGSCRASLLVGPPGVIFASPAADQLTEIHARLDEIWEAAQADPSAGVVELAPPVLNQLKPIPAELAVAEPEPAVEPAAVIEEQAPAPAEDPGELPEAWRPEPEAPEPIEDDPEVVWLAAAELAAALNTSRSNVAGWNSKGLFAGLTRPPARGEGRGERFNLSACKAAYEARPSRRNRTRPEATPLPVVVEDWPPAVEPSAPEATPAAAADAQALLELAGDDAGTLAALRELLACGPV